MPSALSICGMLCRASVRIEWISCCAGCVFSAPKGTHAHTLGQCSSARTHKACASIQTSRRVAMLDTRDHHRASCPANNCGGCVVRQSIMCYLGMVHLHRQCTSDRCWWRNCCMLKDSQAKRERETIIYHNKTSPYLCCECVIPTHTFENV